MTSTLSKAIARAKAGDADSRPKVLRKDLYFRETGYYPHEAQWEIHKSRVRHRALSNGRRWGKTLLGAKEAEITSLVMNRLGEPQRGWIVGPNYDDGEKEYRILYNSLKKLGVDQVSSKFLNNTEQGRMHITTNWGWDCMVKSAAHPETLVGEGLDWVLMVEAGRLHRSTFAQYIRPALSDHRGWSLMTGVPEIATDVSLLYWGWSRGQDPQAKAWASWRMPSWTNPVIFPGGREDEEILEAEADLTDDEFRRQYGGEFVERFGRVMKEWDDEIHLGDYGYNPDWPVYAAVDYGYTNPFVWLWLQVDVWGNVYVLEEHYIELMDTDEIARRILKEHPLMQHLVAFYPDPAEPDDTNTLQRVLRKTARTNTGGALKVRLNLLRRSLKTGPEHIPVEEQQPQLHVDRSCKMLAWEMREGYRWPRHKSEIKNDSELPIDKDNHGPEALGRFFKGYFDAVDGTRRTRQSRVRIHR